MTYNVEIFQDWKIFNEYVTYIAKLKEIEKNVPVKYYSNEGNHVCVIRKEDNNLTMIFTSSSIDVKTVNELFDPRCFDELENGEYLTDYQFSIPLIKIIDKNTKINLKPHLFSFYPPTYYKKNFECQNLFMVGKGDLCCRVFSRTSNLPWLIFLLGKINSITLDSEDSSHHSFGAGLIVSYYKEFYGLPNFTQYELDELFKSIIPKRVFPQYELGELLSQFHTLVRNDNEGEGEDEFEDSYLGRGTLSTLTNSSEEITLTQLLKLKTVPTLSQEIYITMDIEVKGISCILIVPGTKIEVYYDNHLTNSEDIYDLFSISPIYIDCISLPDVESK